MRRIIETSLGVSFKTCLTRRMDERMWRRNYVSVRSRHDVPLRHPVDVPVRCLGVMWDVLFHLRLVWDVLVTYHCEVLGTYPSDVVTTILYDIVETYQWDVLAMYHWEVVGCFIWDVTATSLGRIKTRCCDVATTSPCKTCMKNLLTFHEMMTIQQGIYLIFHIIRIIINLLA